MKPSLFSPRCCYRIAVSARTALAFWCSAFAFAANAQTAGDWQYTISTDLKSIPEDMRVNFPTVTFNACRSVADFESGSAFALQTLASSEARCPSTNFERSRASASGAPAQVSFEFSCDDGKSLTGTAKGNVAAKRFEFAMTTRYPQSVSGVTQVQQTMSARFVGPCKSKPNQDEVKIP
ncbi:MAG: DUF3617 family protein [Betaproteobacteria bacterium]|nr:MAG: DUF3617 family protein [Betaproteobacteria bacterium]